MKRKILTILIVIILTMMFLGCIEENQLSEIDPQEDSDRKSRGNTESSFLENLDERKALTEKEIGEAFIPEKMIQAIAQNSNDNQIKNPNPNIKKEIHLT